MFAKIILPLLIALQFLTKFPINLPRIPTPQENAYSVLCYPLIGLIIGGLLWIIAVYLPIGVVGKAGIVTVFWIWITGGLHLDGLADTVDGLVGGYGDKERILEIMKDPHIGAMGVISIVGAMLLKFVFVFEILTEGKMLPIIIVPILGRLSILFLLLTTPYIRKNGLGSALSEYLPKQLTIIVLILSLMSVLILPIKLAIIILIFFLLLCGYLNFWFKERISGITGDTLGTGVEIMEIGILFIIALT